MNALKRIPTRLRGLMSVWTPYLTADGLTLYIFVAVIIRLLWSRSTFTVIFCHTERHHSLGVMPFGLCNAPATFLRSIYIVLSGLTFDIFLV